MDIYNAWFDLKAGVSDVEFSDRLKIYMNALKGDGLMQGWRLMRRKLGLSWPSSIPRSTGSAAAASPSRACISGSMRWFRTRNLHCIGTFPIRCGTGAMRNSD
jgi:hypothetical protein